MNTTAETASGPVLRCDYRPPPFLIDAVELDIDIREGEALVTTGLSVRRNPVSNALAAPLTLDGEELETLSIAIDGRQLAVEQCLRGANELVIEPPADAFKLQTRVRIRPDANTRLTGLYRAVNGYFTQCEAQGFRRITWFLDRPDVLSRYTVTLRADRGEYPVLLSNGNPVGSGVGDGDAGARHWARWHDPFPKPCYLFAAVAGRLDVARDSYTTRSGRAIALAVYVQPGKADQCGQALEALKTAMRWDEDTFGLECDLDDYKIVAVDDFNMGAMENKGLNIFNSRYVLARGDIATDSDYINIDRVVAHEYFHNWTGNRVTCRDWFQLSLKEGLTVFRDQEFGADVHGGVSRIRDVRSLRASQFPEDAGPMAHPVRPQSYVRIDNFYTATVYQKGAEVVRMIRTLIGTDAFRRGMELYFARHDGQAVTCDDFVAAMAAASGVDLPQFMRWYDQAGTPRLHVSGRYDGAARRYVLTVSQAVPGRPENQPYYIPIAVGLIGPDGTELLGGPDGRTRVLSLTEPTRDFIFENVAAPPTPSLLRGFSAPVILDYPYADADLTHLMAHDSDAFNRWEAAQELAGRLILAATGDYGAGRNPQWPPGFAEAAERVLSGADADPVFAAEVLTPPSEATLAERMAVVDPEALHAARNGLRRFLAERLREAFEACYRRHAPAGPYRFDIRSAARRTLRNLCLSYLMETDEAPVRALAMRQFTAADNMTDQFAALSALAQSEGRERVEAIESFYERWRHEPLVLNKWFSVQATSRRPATVDEVRRLIDHPAFDIRNPNKVYSLLGGFAANHVRFHAADGEGYRLLAEQILRLDALNPQVAARLARAFDRWRRFDGGRQAHARGALERMRNHAGLSRDVMEIVERALAGVA